MMGLLVHGGDLCVIELGLDLLLVMVPYVLCLEAIHTPHLARVGHL